MKHPSQEVALGLRIKELRARNAMTQETLADGAGVFRTYMSRIETGVANPTLSVLLSLAATLGVRVGELFEQPDEYTPKRAKSSSGMSRGRVTR